MNRITRFASYSRTLAALALLTSFASAQGTSTQILGSGARLGGIFKVGKSMDLGDDYLVMGYGDQLYNSGAVVLSPDGSGGWTTESFFDAPGTDGGNEGIAVAVDGNRVVVGTTWFDEEYLEAANVYEKVLGSWQHIGSLGNIVGVSDFGGSVDIDGDTVIVGARGGEFIRIYHYDGSGWSLQLNASPPYSPVYSGYAIDVAVQGDVAVVGAHLHPTDQLSIYRRAGSTWTLAQALNVTDMGTLAAQGYTLLGGEHALDGDTILAILGSTVPGLDSGVCVLRDSGSGYVFEEFIQGSDTVRLDAFGLSIDLDGDTAIVAAPRADGGGAAYLFVRTANGFEEQLKYVSTAVGSTTFFGSGFAETVSISGAAVAFSAPRDISSGGFGGAYVQGPIMSNSMIQAICAGNGITGPTCANCPCGNNALASAVGGCLNSSGTSATLSMMGEARVSADTARLEVSAATPSTVAVLFSGVRLLPNQPVAPCFSGTGVRSLSYNGLRCVGGNIRRHGSRPTDAAGRAGDTNDGWGGPFGPNGGLVAQGGFVVGQERYFQAVYRDAPTGACNTGLNTTNAISVMVIP